MKTNVYRVTVLVVDHDGLGIEGVKTEMENVSYPNDCIHPSVMRIETREVEWDDRHALNVRDTQSKTFWELFAPPCTKCYGQGEHPSYVGFACPRCNGTGKEPAR